MKHSQHHQNSKHRAVVGLGLTICLTLLGRPLLATEQTLPPVLEDNTLSALPEINIKQFNFEGNTVFTDAELLQIIPESDRPPHTLTAERLQHIRNLITQLYVDKGYINSGAILPDQQVQDGVVTLKIIEGQIIRLNVEGTKGLRPSYIETRVKGRQGEVLNVDNVQERLQLLQQDPLIQNLNAELGPGAQLGEAILNLHISEERPFEFQLNLNNHRSPSIGAYRGELEFWHRNLTGVFGHQFGVGDTLYLSYGLTKGLDDYTVRYEFPLHKDDTTLALLWDRSESDVIEEPFKQIDVASQAKTIAGILSYSVPQFKSTRGELKFGLRAEKRVSKTFLLDRPFSFSPGVQDGESHLSVIRFSTDWVNRSVSHVLAAHSSLNFGLDMWDATIHDDDSPDAKFITWIGQFQWVGRLNTFPFLSENLQKNERLQAGQFIFHIDGQFSNEDLLPIEKFSIGGSATVRGYRENYLTRDNGLISSLEVRFPIYKWAIPRISKNPEDGWLYVTPFIDYGRSWNVDSETPSPKSISSVGLGLRYNPGEAFQAALYWGKALREPEEPEEEDLQDKGWHFEMSVKF